MAELRKRVALWAVAAATVTVAASCAQQPSQEIRTNAQGNSNAPGEAAKPAADAPEGFLFPASFLTLLPVPGEYGATAAQKGDDLTVTATRGEAKVVVTSTSGSWLREDANPVRCGDLDDPLSAGSPVEIDGSTGSISVKSTTGTATVTATSPLLAARNPDGLETLPGDEVKGSILLPASQAIELATPGKRAEEILPSWEHDFKGQGVKIRARWAGSMDTEISYIMEFDVDGEETRGVQHSILGIDCNVSSGLGTTVGDVTYAPVLLTGGARLFVDGVEVTDLVPEPPLQGSFGIVAVPRDDKSVKVEVKNQRGEILEAWTEDFVEEEK